MSEDAPPTTIEGTPPTGFNAVLQELLQLRSEKDDNKEGFNRVLKELLSTRDRQALEVHQQAMEIQKERENNIRLSEQLKAKQFQEDVARSEERLKAKELQKEIHREREMRGRLEEQLKMKELHKKEMNEYRPLDGRKAAHHVVQRGGEPG